MILTNEQIYGYAVKLTELFKNDLPKLPIKANFYLIKNKNLLVSLAEEIERARIGIVSTYGEVDASGNYVINDPDTFKIAQEEMNQLSSVEQEVQIYKIDINDFPDDMILTIDQMEALMFMIN